MAQPTYKAPAVDAAITAATGIDRCAVIMSNKCAFERLSCKGPDLNFRDDASRREYSISGICQSCQDSTFGSGE